MPYMNKRQANKPCAVCQLIRRFLIFAAFLLILMWSQPEWRLPAWLDGTKLVGDLFLLAFVLLLAYKLWQHYKNKP